MPVFPSYDSFAFSFSHALLRVDNRLYTAIENIRLSQRLQEAAVFGTSRGPLRRSAGQLELGQGTLVFSDMGEAFDMIQSLSPDFLFRTFTVDYTLVNEQGDTRNIELRGSRFIGFDIDHSQGPDALPAEFPFSFLQMRVNGNELAISVAGILQAFQAITKLF